MSTYQVNDRVVVTAKSLDQGRTGVVVDVRCWSEETQLLVIRLTEPRVHDAEYLSSQLAPAPINRKTVFTRYFNAGSRSVVVVAIRQQHQLNPTSPMVTEWAAYIGACPEQNELHRDAIAEIADSGAKLSADQAMAMIGQFSPESLKLDEYRR